MTLGNVFNPPGFAVCKKSWSATPGLINGPNIENKEFIRIRYEDN